MKNRIKLPAILLGLMLLLTGITQKVMAQDEDVSLQTFYDELSPYGSWIQDSQYGYVWKPDVDQNDFRPYYTNGRWAMTDYGNTWVSDYNWGWAPFHYGRWITDRYNQWVWIPDTTWGPAWVNWRSGGGYYGWAPLGPGMGISVNIGIGGFSIPDFWWSFVPQRNIYYNSFPRYYASRNYNIIHNTTIINNVYVRNSRSYYAGPRREDIQRATRQDVRVYNINRTDRPDRNGISNNNVDIYRPRPSRTSATTGSPAPRTVTPGNVSSRGNRTGESTTTPARPSRTGSTGTTTRPTTPGTGTTTPRTGRTDRGNTGTTIRPSVPRSSSSTPAQRTDRGAVNTTAPRPTTNTQAVQQRQEQAQRAAQQREQQATQRQQQAQQAAQQRQQQAQQATQQREQVQQRQQQAQQAAQQRQQQAQQAAQQRQQQATQQRQQSVPQRSAPSSRTAQPSERPARN